MQWWNDFIDWFNSDEGWRVISGAVIPFVAIVVAGIIGGLIGRNSTRRLLSWQDRELQSAAVAAIIGVGDRASMWSTLPAGEKDHLDAQMSAADIRLRLLPITGSSAAADWASHELALMQRNSANFSFQAEQSFIDYRDRLLEWQRRPGRARKLFAADLERFRFESTDAETELVDQQRKWAADQLAEATREAPTDNASTPAALGAGAVVADAVVIDTPAAETAVRETPVEETTAVEAPVAEAAPIEATPLHEAVVVEEPADGYGTPTAAAEEVPARVEATQLDSPVNTPVSPVEPEPAEFQPEYAEPVYTEPVFAEAAASAPYAEPATAEPTPVEPTPVEPVIAEPVIAEPVAVEPESAEPTADDVPAAEPVGSPTAQGPFVYEPFVPQPFGTEQSPAVPEPAPADEVAAEETPATVEPEPVQPEAVKPPEAPPALIMPGEPTPTSSLPVAPPATLGRRVTRPAGSGAASAPVDPNETQPYTGPYPGRDEL